MHEICSVNLSLMLVLCSATVDANVDAMILFTSLNVSVESFALHYIGETGVECDTG